MKYLNSSKYQDIIILAPFVHNLSEEIGCDNCLAFWPIFSCLNLITGDLTLVTFDEYSGFLEDSVDDLLIKEIFLETFWGVFVF